MPVTTPTVASRHDRAAAAADMLLPFRGAEGAAVVYPTVLFLPSRNHVDRERTPLQVHAVDRH